MTLGVALLGAGRVGGAFIRAVANVGDLDLRHVVIADPRKSRAHHPVDAQTFTTDGLAAIADIGVDVVVDASSCPESAYLVGVAALRQGKLFATASKELAVDYGAVLQHIADTHGGQYRYDASVCAALPTTRVISSHCKGDIIDSIEGVLSGTCNYILWSMESAGLTFDAALEQAKRAGFAEPDPKADLDGTDAARKAVLLSRLAFGHVSETVVQSGIDELAPDAVDEAGRAGASLRLVSLITRTPRGVSIDVQPRALAHGHPLLAAQAESVVRIQSRNMGSIVIRGNGAGPAPTAASLISDALDARCAVPA